MLPKSFLSPAPYHLLAYASVTGMTIWHSYISGPISFKVLPREQFAQLQSKLFPIYFSLQSALLGVCLFTTSNQNARIVLLISGLGALTNLAVIGPCITKTMHERRKLEKEEGKPYNDPGVSDQMKALNKRFGLAHGCSSLINMGIALSLLIYPFIAS